jgi:putative peptide zinc metalloprotease protein
MDYLETPNLHARSFALARWKLRCWIFGPYSVAPEYFSPSKTRALILFAWGTWLYRFLMFIGIAILVYYALPKPLGPLLATIEIVWFILMPIVAELKVMVQSRNEFLKVGGWQKSAVLAILFLGLILFPWDRRVSTSGLIVPVHSASILMPGDGKITRIIIQDGMRVEAGQHLMDIENSDLEFQLARAQAQNDVLIWRKGASGFNEEWRAQIPIIEAEQKRVQAEIQGLKTMQDKFTITAQMDEMEVKRINIGDVGRFYSDSGIIPPLVVRVIRIDSDATRVLSDPVLAKHFGGNIVVREQNDQLIPEQAVYRITLALEDAGPMQRLANQLLEVRGRAVLKGTAQSWAGQYWRAATALFRREAGF